MKVGDHVRVTNDAEVLALSGVVSYYNSIKGCECRIERLPDNTCRAYIVKMLGGQEAGSNFSLLKEALLSPEDYRLDKLLEENGCAITEKMGVPNGARKDDKGKPDFKYLQYVGRALAACCEVWEAGYIKYGEVGGWQKVPDGINRYQSALLRHALYYPARGETRDHELSEIMNRPILHKAAVAVNALMVLELTLQEMEGESTIGRQAAINSGKVSVPEVYDV